MQRRWSPLLGLVLLVLVAGILSISGPVRTLGDPAAALQVVVLGTAGCCFVLAGVRTPGGVRWYHLAGAGDVLLGVSFLVRLVSVATAPGVSAGAIVFNTVGTLGGLALAYLGVDLARGGRSLDIDRDAKPLF